MKPEELLGEHLRRRIPSSEEERVGLDRVRMILSAEPKVLLDESRHEVRSRFFWVAAAAMGVFAVALSVLLVWNRPPALVETVDGEMLRVSAGEVSAIHSGQPLAFGEIIRSRVGAGAVLALADGSRIEMRSKSELVLQNARDGVLLQLNDGSIIVTAAKQRNGHLYVRTRDVTVSVIGTVFMVNAEEAGSRVAVIQGEVRVQQGATEKKLLPGEQVASNPLMESHPVNEEISWSRNAEKHLAMLHQLPPEMPARHELRFDVASIRADNAGGNPGRGSCRGIDSVIPADRMDTMPPLGRCVFTRVYPKHIISYAYDLERSPLPRNQMVTGGPDWLYVDELFTIEAKTESPATTTEAELIAMLKNLLAERFKLKFHREAKEVDGMVLFVAKSGSRLVESHPDEVTAWGISSDQQEKPKSAEGALTITGRKASMSRLVMIISSITRVAVVDKTNLAGFYTFKLSWDDVAGPSLATALQEQLGLRSESQKVPVEIFVVESAERPTAN